MTNDEIENLLGQVESGTILPRAAIALLTVSDPLDGSRQFDEDQARELVFITLGGGDLVSIDVEGQERYARSGRLVSEVAADMER